MASYQDDAPAIYKPEFADTIVPANGTYPWYYSTAPSLLPWMSDRDLALFSTVAAYWIYSLFFHVLDTWGTNWKWLDPYRLHESEEVKTRNLVSRSSVVAMVLFQQAVQTIAGMLFLESGEPEIVDHWAKMRHYSPIIVQSTLLYMGDPIQAQKALQIWGSTMLHLSYWWLIPTLQMLWSFFIIDTWQYWFHRTFHVNKFLYRHFHSWHHRLYVPYAYGALYNHPVEGFLLDTIGTLIAQYLSGMSTRQSVLLFTFATLKTVDDHCGYSLPFDPLQMLFSNNADYHDIHHQSFGIKKNFSQPFFVHWDTIMGTKLTRKDLAAAAAKKKRAAELAQQKQQSLAADGMKEKVE